MGCKQKNINSLHICLGDLNKKITILERAITPVDDASDYSQNFTIIKRVWSAVESRGINTLSGSEPFDNVSISESITHTFYIKYLNGIDITNFVEYNNKYFKIISIININEDNRWLLLKASELGSTSYEANWQ